MWIYKCWKTAFSKIKPAIRENTSSGKRQWCGGEEGMGLCSMRWYDDNSMWGGSGWGQEAVGNETQRQRKSHGRFPSSGSWQPEEGCVSLPIRHRSEREGALPVSLSITPLQKTWPICGPSATLAGRSTKQSVHPTHRYGAVIWGEGEIMELSVEGTQWSKIMLWEMQCERHANTRPTRWNT